MKDVFLNAPRFIFSGRVSHWTCRLHVWRSWLVSKLYTVLPFSNHLLPAPGLQASITEAFMWVLRIQTQACTTGTLSHLLSPSHILLIHPFSAGH